MCLIDFITFSVFAKIWYRLCPQSMYLSFRKTISVLEKSRHIIFGLQKQFVIGFGMRGRWASKLQQHVHTTAAWLQNYWCSIMAQAFPVVSYTSLQTYTIIYCNIIVIAWKSSCRDWKLRIFIICFILRNFLFIIMQDQYGWFEHPDFSFVPVQLREPYDKVRNRLEFQSKLLALSLIHCATGTTEPSESACIVDSK